VTSGVGRRAVLQGGNILCRGGLEPKFEEERPKLSYLPAHLLEAKAKSLLGTLRELTAIEQWLGGEVVTPTMYPALEAKVAELLVRYKSGTISSRFALFRPGCKQAVRAGLLPAVRSTRTSRSSRGCLAGDWASRPLLFTWPMLRREPVPQVWLPLTKTDLGKAFVFDGPQATALLGRLHSRPGSTCHFASTAAAA
jgi:hypothetical protein